MKLRLFFVLCCSATLAFSAHADIYKRVDDEGHVTYSSKPLKGGKKIFLEPLPTMPATPVPKPGADSDHLRVNPETQSKRDDTRRKILEDELATEQKALEDAQAKLKEGQENPEVFKTPSGQVVRNVAKYDEKVGKLQEEVTAHEKNVEALKTELGNIK